MRKLPESRDVIDDFTLVARAAREKSKKYGTFQCCIGFSKSRGRLFRLGPTPPMNPLRAWGTYRVNCVKTTTDSRKGSRRLDVDSSIVKTGDEDRYKSISYMLNNFLSGSIAELNNDRMSIALVIPERIEGFSFKEVDVDDGFEYGAAGTKHRPYLKYVLAGKKHRQQVREMGCFEFLRKNPERRTDIFKNKKLGEPGVRHALLIGNMLRNQNNWLVVDMMQINVRKLESAGLVGNTTMKTLNSQGGFSTSRQVTFNF